MWPREAVMIGLTVVVGTALLAAWLGAGSIDQPTPEPRLKRIGTDTWFEYYLDTKTGIEYVKSGQFLTRLTP